MDFFELARKEYIRKEAPLADRMRPRTLDEFFGQGHILSPGRLLRRAIQADQLSSILFFGPPGTGKTTLARIIANNTKAEFLSLNAVLSGVKEIRECIAKAGEYLENFQRKTILFIDEVHRFNKSQQDALLPHVENGTVILIGATTENPYFEVNKALVSRSRIFQLKPLNTSDIRDILLAALKDKERGFGHLDVHIDNEAVEHLINVANGDARAALNALELAVITSEKDETGVIKINLAVAEESIQQRAVLYDKDGDAHFDTISAFIKSLRGSDPDAALYWMAKMIYAGENPRFIFRRMIIFAGEDVGMADPNALTHVVAAATSFDYVGMPEGRFHLAQACLYLATAPKSNSAFAFFDALSVVKDEKEADTPNHLKDANRDKKGFGHGEGYLYPHAYRDHWVAQQYLPTALQGKIFYEPTEQGFEGKVKLDVIRRREAQLASMLDTKETQGDNDALWRDRTLGNRGELLAEIRDTFFGQLSLKKDDMILNLNAGNGLFLGESIRCSPEGTVYGLVTNEKEKEILTGKYQEMDQLSCPIIRSISENSLLNRLSRLLEEKIRFNAIIGLNPLQQLSNCQSVLEKILLLLSQNGFFAFVENLASKGQRISEFLSEENLVIPEGKNVLLAEAEFFLRSQKKSDCTEEEIIKDFLGKSGFKIIKEKVWQYHTPTFVSSKKFDSWFEKEKNTNDQSTFAQVLSEFLSAKEIDSIKALLLPKLRNKTVVWRSNWFFALTKIQ